MKTTTPRDLTWDQIRDQLDGAREAIWTWLRAHGPATTTAIASGTGIPLLTVRPRVSELAALGWIECRGRSGREGAYGALAPEVCLARHQEHIRETQLPLPLE